MARKDLEDQERVSLAPLEFREALKGLLAVKPDEKSEESSKDTEDNEGS